MAAHNNILLESGTNELEVVEFTINYIDKKGDTVEQSFGVNVAKIREIIRMPELTIMPKLPDMVRGIFNLRDSLIPALDLSKFLYGSENRETGNKMIIAEFNKIRVGFIVNDVRRIHRISWSDIVSPDTMQEFDPEKSSIIGLIHFDGSHILMLDVEKIVADIDPLSAIDNSHPKQFSFDKKIALTAEDSSTIRKMITERLKSAGFEILAFKDGLEAWEKLQEISSQVSKGTPLESLLNIVITDIEMPRMDGYSLTKNMREDSNLSSIPVVIFSSIISDEVLHKGRAVGANAQLTKPQIGELLETVRVLLD